MMPVNHLIRPARRDLLLDPRLELGEAGLEAQLELAQVGLRDQGLARVIADGARHAERLVAREADFLEVLGEAESVDRGRHSTGPSSTVYHEQGPQANRPCRYQRGRVMRAGEIEAFAEQPEAAAVGVLDREVVARQRIGVGRPARATIRAPGARARAPWRPCAGPGASGTGPAARRAAAPPPRSARAGRAGATAAPAPGRAAGAGRTARACPRSAPGRGAGRARAGGSPAAPAG